MNHSMMMSLSGCGETAGGPSSTAASESTVAQLEKKNIDYDAVFENLSYLSHLLFCIVYNCETIKNREIIINKRREESLWEISKSL